MDNLIVILVILASVWYLFSRFRKMLNPDEPGCGCGCGSECGTKDKNPPEATGD